MFTSRKRKSKNNKNIYDIISKDLLRKDIIQKIILRYINNNECFIKDKLDIYLISNYLFHNQRIQQFIKLNKLTINDFISLISSSKIITSNDNRLIYKEGDSQHGFYILIKGSLLVKISKMSMPSNIDLFFKKEILQEYNLENDSKIIWLKENEIKEYNTKTLSYKFLTDKKMINFSPYSCIFQQKHEQRIQISKRNSFYCSKDSFDNTIYFKYNEEVELFLYNLDINDSLFFGGVNLFNEYMREKPQIHLTSAYLYNKKNCNENDNNNINNIILYIDEDKIKELLQKISLLNKGRIPFLLNKLTILNNMTITNRRYFISTIKMIYINIESKKELINDKNIFYLVYQGSCLEKKRKEIIYDSGSFICLNNIFLNNNKCSNTTVYSKGTNVILFCIDLNYLSENNKENMKKYLENIFDNQYIARAFHMNNIISYENRKIKEKINNEENKLKNYFISNSISLLNNTEKQFINKKYQIIKNNNKNLKNIYLNKNIYQKIRSSRIILKFKNISLNKKKLKYFLKNKNKSNSSSNNKIISNLSYVNEKSIIINNNQNTIKNNSNNYNNCFNYNYNSKTYNTELMNKNNNKNNFYMQNNNFTINNLGFSSFLSHSHLYFDKSIKKDLNKEEKSHKFMLLRNIKFSNNKGNNN